MSDTDQIRADAVAGLITATKVLQELGGAKRLRKKQLLGGQFTDGSYWVCSSPAVMRGLDGAMFFVYEGKSEFVIGTGFDRNGAVSIARSILENASLFHLQLTIARFVAEREKAEQEELARRKAEHAELERSKRPQRAATIRSIPRRRRQIFDSSGGKCHYCQTTLTLDGKWHIDHKMPRALGGDNTPGNLVASCTPCNHEKRDTTDREFLAKRAAKGAA